MKELLRWNKINLKILSKVKPSGKISTRGKVLSIEKDSVFQGLWRFLFQDSRSEAVETIKSIIQVALELTQCIIQSYSFQMVIKGQEEAGLTFQLQSAQLTQIKDDLYEALNGIKNLTIGYKDDEKIVSELEVLAQNVEQEVTNIQTALQQAHHKSFAEFAKKLVNVKK